jgi:hypothetical protein
MAHRNDNYSRCAPISMPIRVPQFLRP